jgi:rhodanese-related sulfurtransferase
VRRADRGVLLADRFERRPPLTTEPEWIARVADLADDPGEGGAVPVDVRSPEAFAVGHLPKARSLAAGGGWDVGKRLAVPRTTPLVFYGVNALDAEPFEAARAARAEGFSAVRVLLGGIREWVKGGRPTAVAPARFVPGGRAGVVLLDVRPRVDVDAGAIPGSVSTPISELRPEPLSGRPYWPPLVLVGRDGQDPAVADALDRIRRWRSLDAIEKTQPIQILEGGFQGWRAAGGVPGGADSLADPRRLGSFDDPELVEPEEFRAAWSAGGGDALLLDVRPGMRPGQVPSFARNIPIGELAARLGELPRDREIWVYCGSGRRAAVARELLARQGFRARFLKDYPPHR